LAEVVTHFPAVMQTAEQEAVSSRNATTQQQHKQQVTPFS
jgi:hypothetical protein